MVISFIQWIAEHQAYWTVASFTQIVWEPSWHNLDQGFITFFKVINTQFLVNENSLLCYKRLVRHLFWSLIKPAFWHLCRLISTDILVWNFKYQICMYILALNLLMFKAPLKFKGYVREEYRKIYLLLSFFPPRTECYLP